MPVNLFPRGKEPDIPKPLPVNGCRGEAAFENSGYLFERPVDTGFRYAELVHVSQIKLINACVKIIFVRLNGMKTAPPPTQRELAELRHLVPKEIVDADDVAWYIQIENSAGFTLLTLYRQMVLSAFYAENS